MNKQTHNDVMANLMKSQSVKNYLDQEQVKLGVIILKKRLDLGLTQSQLITIANRKDIKLTQAQLSRVENGDPNLGVPVYKNALHALGGHLKLGVQFDDEPKQKVLAHI